MTDQQISIRNALPKDLLALAGLITELGYPTSLEDMRTRFENISDHNDYRIFIACIGTEVAGMMGTVKNYFYEQNGFYIRLTAVVISQAQRHQGIGKILLQHVEAWAKENGAVYIMLNCGNREERKHAHEFYQKNGYQVRSSGYFKKL